MSLRKKWGLLVLLAGILALSIFGYNYIYQDHRDIPQEKAAFSLSAKQMAIDFEKGDGNHRYIDQVVEVHGPITERGDNHIIVNDHVQATFLDRVDPKIATGTFITLKGRCIGYDNLLELVKIDQATILSNQPITQ